MNTIHTLTGQEVVQIIMNYVQKENGYTFGTKMVVGGKINRKGNSLTEMLHEISINVQHIPDDSSGQYYV